MPVEDVFGDQPRCQAVPDPVDCFDLLRREALGVCAHLAEDGVARLALCDEDDGVRIPLDRVRCPDSLASYAPRPDLVDQMPGNDCRPLGAQFAIDPESLSVKNMYIAKLANGVTTVTCLPAAISISAIATAVK